MAVRISISTMILTYSSILVSAHFKEPDPDSANWTSCHEFVNNTTLDPDKLIDIDWKIFFFWSPVAEASYIIRFSKPSEVLIDRFRVELNKTLVPPANWSNTILFMETSTEFSSLVLKTPTPGLFRFIPNLGFKYNIPTPLLIFGFKLVEPGYLGISNCKYRICYALAPVDKMPYHYELEKAAKTLKFYNPHNRTHIAPPPKQEKKGVPYSLNVADDDEDEDLEIDMDLNKDFL